MIIKTLTPKQWQDKTFYEVTFEEDATPRSCWDNLSTFKVGDEIKGEFTLNKKGYPAFVQAKTYPNASRPNMDRIMEKKETAIAVAQDRKADSIRQAQDRSAWMWAKNNAVELLKGKTVEVYDVIDLATKIYNAEPLEPFSEIKGSIDPLNGSDSSKIPF